MKKLYLLTLFTTIIICCQNIQAQMNFQNEVKIYYGLTESSLGAGQELIGGPGYNVENSFETGIRYIWRLPNGIGLETGANFWQGDVIITSAPMPEQTTRTEELKITTIPVFVNYEFWNYFYINGGPVMDFQSTDSSFAPQSGIGLGVGLGAQYAFNRFLVYINPNWRMSSLIPFEKENHHPRLQTLGVQFGLGYSF